MGLIFSERRTSTASVRRVYPPMEEAIRQRNGFYHPGKEDELLQRVLSHHRENHPKENGEEIITAFRFAKLLHSGQIRGDGTPYITHPTWVALQMAKRGYGANAIKAGFLHDVVEDHNVKVSFITEVFGMETAIYVGIVTKPRLIDGTWRSAFDPEFYSKPNEYQPWMYDMRAIKQYGLLFGSGSSVAAVLKFFDNIHNLTTMNGMAIGKRDRNIETMLEHLLWIAPRILSEQEHKNLVQELRVWGYEIPGHLLPIKVRESVIVLPPRKFSKEFLLKLPVPGNHASLYTDPNSPAFFEIGLPPDLELLSARETRGLFGTEVRLGASLVPERVRAHETILQILGFRGSLDDARAMTENLLFEAMERTVRLGM